MAERLLELGEGLELWRVGVDELREQDVNARRMTEAMFGRLTQTIKRDRRLESLPLVAQTPRGLEVVSGHHRVRAARAAEVQTVHVVVDVTGLTPGQIRAKQLAHNAIQGADDPELVARIFAEIGDVDARLESFVDQDAIAGLLARARVTSVDLRPEHRTALIVFLPYEHARFEAAATAVEAHIGGDVERVYLAELRLVETFQRLLARVGRAYDIRAIGTIFARMAEIVEEHLGVDRPEPDAVALRDVFGATFVDPALARALEHRMAALAAAGALDPKNRVEILRTLLDDDDVSMETNTLPTPARRRNGRRP